MSWVKEMGVAYARGLEDGKRGSNGDATRGGGFDACYWRGFGHGAGECRCPSELAGRRAGKWCVVCGHRRHKL